MLPVLRYVNAVLCRFKNSQKQKQRADPNHPKVPKRHQMYYVFPAEPGMFCVSLSRQYKIRFMLFSRLPPWLHDAVFVKSTWSIINQNASLVVFES